MKRMENKKEEHGLPQSHFLRKQIFDCQRKRFVGLLAQPFLFI